MSGPSGARAALVAFALITALAPAPAGAAAAAVFDSNPDRHALVVVDVRVRQKTLLGGSEAEIRSGSLRATPTLQEPTGREHTAHAIAGVLPFTVEPGRYRAAFVKAEARRMQAGTGTIELGIALPTDSLADLGRVVEAGSVIYLGRVEVQSIPRPFKENDYRFTVAYDRGRERQVWEKLLAKGSTGAWEQAIRARLVALSAANAVTASPGPAPADTAR